MSKINKGRSGKTKSNALRIIALVIAGVMILSMIAAAVFSQVF